MVIHDLDDLDDLGIILGNLHMVSNKRCSTPFHPLVKQPWQPWLGASTQGQAPITTPPLDMGMDDRGTQLAMRPWLGAVHDQKMLVEPT